MELSKKLKNTAGIWYRTANNAAKLVSGNAIKRTAAQVHSEYSTLPKDWETLESPVLVRTQRGLSVVSHLEFREQYAAILEQAIGITRAKRLIEFGCGEGLNIGLLKRADVELHGFDLVPERVRRAKERLPHMADRLWIGDATVAQAPPNSFDLAYAVHAIEQMQDGWKAAISRMREVAPYVLLMEPFYERKSIHGRMHSRINGYFRGTIAEAMSLGFSLVREFEVPYLDVFNPTTALLLKR